MISIDFLKNTAIGFALFFAFHLQANEDMCPYASHAYGSYSAVSRSNICADSTVSQTLTSCAVGSSSSNIIKKKRVSRGKK